MWCSKREIWQVWQSEWVTVRTKYVPFVNCWKWISPADTFRKETNEIQWPCFKNWGAKYPKFSRYAMIGDLISGYSIFFNVSKSSKIKITMANPLIFLRHRGLRWDRLRFEAPQTGRWLPQTTETVAITSQQMFARTMWRSRPFKTRLYTSVHFGHAYIPSRLQNSNHLFLGGWLEQRSPRRWSHSLKSSGTNIQIPLIMHGVYACNRISELYTFRCHQMSCWNESLCIWHDIWKHVEN